MLSELEFPSLSRNDLPLSSRATAVLLKTADSNETRILHFDDVLYLR